jgi:putative ubiquitin-RnfH superfamily antitoxin RatB of RatAB toxin-antitoxin module
MGSGAARRITVEVVYATAERQTLVEFEVTEGTTVGQAIDLSGIRAAHPEIGLCCVKTGIFGRLAALDAVLRERDRVEIYRPLRADPKEARRRRTGNRMRRAAKD